MCGDLSNCVIVIIIIIIIIHEFHRDASLEQNFRALSIRMSDVFGYRMRY